MATNRPVPKSAYYSGQGRLIIGERDPVTGKPLNLYEVGNCTALEITIATTETDHKESMTGERAIDFTIVSEKNATFTITCESLSLKNLALGFWGSTATKAAGTVAAEPIKIAPGAYVALANQNVSAVIITTTGGTPAPVPTTAYSVDPEFGVIRFNDTATAGDGTVEYEFGEVSRLEALTQVAAPERYLRFEGINTLNEELVLVEIPRAQFSPLQNLPLINEEVASFEIAGKILQDPLAGEGDAKYYRQTLITAA
ncbi:hypothetical protein UFRH6_7 [Pseudomonas phage UF_RH6]|nr:hypothetical protein UFRH6_7 [Pseudomonas phage UF_RH6]